MANTNDIRQDRVRLDSCRRNGEIGTDLARLDSLPVVTVDYEVEVSIGDDGVLGNVCVLVWGFADLPVRSDKAGRKRRARKCEGSCACVSLRKSSSGCHKRQGKHRYRQHGDI